VARCSATRVEEGSQAADIDACAETYVEEFLSHVRARQIAPRANDATIELAVNGDLWVVRVDPGHHAAAELRGIIGLDESECAVLRARVDELTRGKAGEGPNALGGASWREDDAKRVLGADACDGGPTHAANRPGDFRP